MSARTPVLTVQERWTLTRLAQRLELLKVEFPNLASHQYTYAEVVPDFTLTPERVRSVVRDQLAELSRVFLIEQYVLENIAFNGVPFLDWEANPGAVPTGTIDMTHRIVGPALRLGFIGTDAADDFYEGTEYR